VIVKLKSFPMKIFLISCIVFASVFCINVSAQILQLQPDSIPQNDYLLTNFENNSNSSNLISKIDFDINIRKFNIYLRNNFTSDVTKLSEKFFRDYNDLEFITTYSLHPNFFAGVGVQSEILSDQRNVEINKNNNYFYFANVDFIPIPKIFVNSKLGYKREDQIGELNTGFHGDIKSEFVALNIQDYISDGRLDMSYENLNQKIHYNFEINSEVYKRFTENADNNSIIRAFNTRNDFYIPATTTIANTYNIKNNIQTRFENHVYLGDELRYFFAKNFLFGFSGVFLTKNILFEYKYKPSPANVIFENIYDSKVFENNLEANARLEYSSMNLFSRLQISYSERSENHELINKDGLTQSQIRELEKTEKNKNNNSQTTSLFLEAKYRLTNTNSFKFIGSSSILKYDTDSDENFDDRDEVTVIGSLSHEYNNLRNFNVETTFEINIATLAYLFQERSSNNNVNRIYKLTSKSNFSPLENLLTVNSFEVLANYTVYDFEDLISQIQSFSYRQLSLKDSVFYNLTRRLSFEVFSDIKIYEQGEFNDKDFSVRPLRYFDERKINSQVSYLFYDFLRISLGYSYFVQKTFEFDEGEKKLKQTIRNYGPLGKISIILNNNSSIDVSASKDYLRSDDGTINSATETVLINILWNI